MHSTLNPPGFISYRRRPWGCTLQSVPLSSSRTSLDAVSLLLSVSFSCSLLPLVSCVVRRFPLSPGPSSRGDKWKALSKRPLANPRKSHSVQRPSLPEGNSSCCAELVDPRLSPVWTKLGAPERTPYCLVFSGFVCVSKPVAPLLDGSEDLPGVWYCGLFRTRAASQARHPVDCRRSRSGNVPPKGLATKLTVVSTPRNGSVPFGPAAQGRNERRSLNSEFAVAPVDLTPKGGAPRLALRRVPKDAEQPGELGNPKTASPAPDANRWMPRSEDRNTTGRCSDPKDAPTAPALSE